MVQRKETTHSQRYHYDTHGDHLCSINAVLFGKLVKLMPFAGRCFTRYVCWATIYRTSREMFKDDQVNVQGPGACITSLPSL